ncbi:hypothetical protein BVX98_03440 [bacterium F11]|nr:hypothetical protein BVX98_03440 [bacterium F11]
MSESFFGYQLSLLIAGLALLYAFSNGFRDSSTIVATVVSTRALSPRKAFLLCALFEFLGALLIGSAVIMTIGKNLFQFPSQYGHNQILVLVGSGLSAAILWGGISWWRAWPTSNNQALLGGLFGSSLALWGIQGINLSVLLRVFLVLIISPLIGFLVSAVVTMFIRYVGEWLTPQVKPIIQKIHIGSCLLVSCAHGSNDGQIVIGLILLISGLLHPGSSSSSLEHREWFLGIRFFVALFIASGVLMGGKRILKKMGMKFYRIMPTQGLGAQLTSAGTILSCALAGFPASTMQVITGSVVGAGVAKNPKSIRWTVAEEIVLSWMITIPSAGILGFVFCTFAKYLAAGS